MSYPGWKPTTMSASWRHYVLACLGQGKASPWAGVSRWLSRGQEQWRPPETITGNVALTLAAWHAPPHHSTYCLVPNHLLAMSTSFGGSWRGCLSPDVSAGALNNPLSPTSRLPQTWRIFLLSVIVEITKLSGYPALKMPPGLKKCYQTQKKGKKHHISTRT